MEMTERNTEAPKQAVGAPFAWLVQSTSERNPPHGWAVHMFNGQQLRDSIPVYLQSEVDRLRDERDTHARWRQDLVDKLDEVERHRDAIALMLNKIASAGEMLAAVVQGAKEEFVRVPYGASHEDVAAINDWHKMAAEALAEWENKT